MKLYRFAVINAERDQIKVIVAQNQEIAAKKLEFLYGANRYFLKLKKIKEV